jgi:hyperosmotically inducible periplasmic protein
MKSKLLRRTLMIGGVTLLAALSAFTQEHKWAGRTLDDLESTVHERLASLPYHGVFDSLEFEVQGKTVTLAGQVIKDSVKQNAERAVKRLNGVEAVINHIEVLPSSRRDDALRINVYRAIYQNPPMVGYGADGVPSIHIIVKNGLVSLEGVVNSEADRGMVHIRALNVTAHVTDNLRVAPGE